MGIRFPLEQNRPDVTEVIEAAAIRRTPPGEEAVENSRAGVHSGHGIRPSDDKDAIPQAPIPAPAEEESQALSNLGDTGKQLDILA